MIEFSHLIHLEPTRLYGDRDAFSYWFMQGQHSGSGNIVYLEQFKLTLICFFDFSKFPFDAHDCNIEFGESYHPIDKGNIQILRCHDGWVEWVLM